MTSNSPKTMLPRIQRYIYETYGQMKTAYDRIVKNNTNYNARMFTQSEIDIDGNYLSTLYMIELELVSARNLL